MNDITRFEPFNEITRFDPFLSRFDPFRDMDDVFSKFMMHPFSDGKMKIDPRSGQAGNGKEGIERVICRNRSYGMASRSFTLSDEVDQSKVQARYNNGGLELTLPKKPGSSRKEISIS